MKRLFFRMAGLPVRTGVPSRIRLVCVLFLFLFSFAVAATKTAPVLITVSPDGPISSFRQAVEEVRKHRDGLRPIIVEFRAGTYPMTEPVVFGPRDSGTKQAPIIYRAKKGEEVVLSGGRVLTGWEDRGGGLWSLGIPEVAEGKWYFEQLYIGGRRAIRCREPDEFYFYTEEPVDMALDSATGKPESMEHRAFIASAGDIEALRKVSKERLADVTLTMYNSWETANPRVQSIDFERRMIQFTGPTNAKLMRWEPRQRYHIENYREALDRPGEWFLDRDGTLYYMPLPGEDPRRLETVAPVAPALMRFEGNVEKDRPEGHIEYLRFEGLKFRHSAYVVPPRGDPGGQSALSIPFSTVLDGCSNVEFTDCQWAHIGGSAVRFHQACADCRFIGNEVYDLGANGVFIGLGHQANWQQIRPTERITVENCVIRDGGKVALGGIGVWIGHGSYNNILHNDISEFYYTGVSVGWQWGYQPSRSHHNTIRFNRIHHLGHGVLSDMGGVYTLGLSPGTVVSDNVIHDVYAYSYGGWGLYTDEGSTGIVMENNLVYRVKTGTFHQHYGKENIVRNNILAYSLTDQIQRSRVEEHVSFFLENNIILWDRGVLFGHPWTKDLLKQWGDDKVVIKNNLYWKAGLRPDDPIFPGGLDLAAWREKTGHDSESIIADPKFRDPENGDFTLPDDSPALRVGFKRFDYSKAGVYGDKVWIDRARNYPHPVRPPAPEKPAPLPFPAHYRDDFETLRSRPVPKASVNDEGKSLIRLSTDRPARGKQCLELAESKELKHGFNPHFYYVPHYETGTVRCAFFIRTQKNACPHVEWRDRSGPYRVGPTLRIRDGKLFVPDREPIDFPEDQWVRIEMVSDLGSDTKTWDLTLEFADGRKQSLSAIKQGHPEWKTLDWLGFCNLAVTDETASFFLDEIDLENRRK